MQVSFSYKSSTVSAAPDDNGQMGKVVTTARLRVSASGRDRECGLGCRAGTSMSLSRRSQVNTQRMAIGLPGEPVAPLNLTGANTKANSYTPSAASADRSRFSKL